MCADADGELICQNAVPMETLLPVEIDSFRAGGR